MRATLAVDHGDKWRPRKTAPGTLPSLTPLDAATAPKSNGGNTASAPHTSPTTVPKMRPRRSAWDDANKPVWTGESALVSS
jgi:hypothetical protein